MKLAIVYNSKDQKDQYIKDITCDPIRNREKHSVSQAKRTEIY